MFTNIVLTVPPSQAGIPDPPSMSSALSERKEEERRFLEQLLDGSKLENYPIPVPVKAELRKYQQVLSFFEIKFILVSVIDFMSE